MVSTPSGRFKSALDVSEMMEAKILRPDAGDASIQHLVRPVVQVSFIMGDMDQCRGLFRYLITPVLFGWLAPAPGTQGRSRRCRPAYRQGGGWQAGWPSGAFTNVRPLLVKSGSCFISGVVRFRRHQHARFGGLWRQPRTECWAWLVRPGWKMLWDGACVSARALEADLDALADLPLRTARRYRLPTRPARRRPFDMPPDPSAGDGITVRSGALRGMPWRSVPARPGDGSGEAVRVQCGKIMKCRECPTSQFCAVRH